VQCAIGELGDDLQFFFPTRERQSSEFAVQATELISSFSKFGTLYTVIGSRNFIEVFEAFKKLGMEEVCKRAKSGKSADLSGRHWILLLNRPPLSSRID
jgi:hypothetical protein